MINWQAVDTVLLDMDGTLLDLEFDNWFWQQHVPACYADANGLPFDEAERILLSWIKRHQGTLNWYCLDFWSDELKLNIAQIKREVGDRIAVRPGTLDFLDALHRSDKQVVMVTNAHRDALDLKLEKTRIDRYFDALISSHDYGHPKEDQAFWHRLQEQQPFNPERTILFDDSLPVLHSARTYGIAQPVSILHPDSSLPKRSHTEPFFAVDEWQHAMPNNETTHG